MTRRPCVADIFYPGDRAGLEKALEGHLEKRRGEKAIAVMAPHAGYVYSGGVAGALYSSIKIPDNVVLIGPNHTGMGPRASIMAEGVWDTPLGPVEINTELAYSMIGFGPNNFTEDRQAHLREHSLEVQLPFLKYLNPAMKFVPVTIKQAPYPVIMEMGTALAQAVSQFNGETLIVVSTDMNHYEDDKSTRVKDRAAIDMILKLDERGLLETAYKEQISMCGLFPAAIAIVASKLLGAKQARLIKYATSGEVSGDMDRVVGYAGISIA